MRDRRLEREALHHKDMLAIAKHTLDFLTTKKLRWDRRAGRSTPVSSDATVILSAPPVSVKGVERVGCLRTLAGGMLLRNRSPN
jgi:hypothetical protein